MNEQNKSLLESIDVIEDRILESDLDVCYSLADNYIKMAYITEYATDTTAIEEFEIFQEASGVEKVVKSAKKSLKKVFKFITSLVSSFINFIQRKFKDVNYKLKTIVKTKRKAHKKAIKKKNVKKFMKNIKHGFSKLGDSIKSGDAANLIVAATTCATELNTFIDVLENRKSSETPAATETPEAAATDTAAEDSGISADEVSEIMKNSEDSTPAEPESTPEETTTEPGTEVVETPPEVKAKEVKVVKAAKAAAEDVKKVKVTATKLKEYKKGTPQYKHAVEQLKSQIASLQKRMGIVIQVTGELDSTYEQFQVHFNNDAGDSEETAKDWAGWMNKMIANLCQSKGYTALLDETKTINDPDFNGVHPLSYELFYPCFKNNTWTVEIKMAPLTKTIVAYGALKTFLAKSLSDGIFKDIDAAKLANVQKELADMLVKAQQEYVKYMKDYNTAANAKMANSDIRTIDSVDNLKKFNDEINDTSNKICAEVEASKNLTDQNVQQFSGFLGEKIIKPIANDLKTAQQMATAISETIDLCAKA